MSPSRVAIVVPCYNVEEFLDACLESVIEQTYRELQIILVDDGSIDTTPALVDRWESRDERIVVIRQTNAGLGAARNVGLDHADAEYVFFLDSDDMLPRDAIERLVGSGEQSGSDLISGVAARFNSKNVWRSGMYRSCFDTDHRGTHLFVEPDLLYDHIACSKLFRLDFWRREGLMFPTGVLFEDIELVTRAHCLAASVDLISTPTYLWRERNGTTSSITQHRWKPGSTTARFDALAAVDSYLRQSAPAAIWQAHAAKAFSLDVPTYCRLIETAPKAYAAEFTAAAGELARRVSPAGIERLGAVERVLWERLRDGDEDGVRSCASILAGRNRSTARAVMGLAQHGPELGARAVKEEAGRLVEQIKLGVWRNTIRPGRAAAIDGVRRAARAYALFGSRRARVGPSEEALDAAVHRAVVAERVVDRLAATRILGGRPAPGRTAPPRFLRVGTVGAIEARITIPADGVVKVSVPGGIVTVARVVLLHEQERLEVGLPRDADGFSLDLRHLTRFGRRATFRGGTWNLLAIDDEGRPWTLTSAAPVHVVLPDPEAGATYVLRHERGGVNLWVESLVPRPERAPIPEEVIRSTAWRRAAAGRRSRAVLYECYFGRSVGCHPRALFERLRHDLPGDVEHVFVTQPGFLHAPQGARTVLRRTREYYDLLASAPLVVTNCDLMTSFQRGAHQVVVQTWHGTPLKRIGLDIESPRLFGPDFQRNLARQCAQWSVLVSPTDDTDEIFPRAFAYQGELIRAGNPRNDRLVLPPAGEREAVRARLGLADEQTAVLFAPTFRDDAHTDAGYKSVPQCDIATLARSLPSAAAVLFRAHTNIRASEIPWPDERIVNVSDYPDVQDLLLAADVLVTDYSSLMFDWSITGKPIVLYAPDLARYRDTRDFYYDYEATMPVPAATTQVELEEALRHAVAGPPGDYDDFVKRFSGRDDGRATERVVSRILQLVSY